jgi:soluble lytic murein transglycosylase
MWYRKKRTFAIIFIAVLLFIYLDQGILGRWMYPIRYDPLIAEFANVYEIDPYLVASIIRVESNFHADKTSDKGAVGLMQLMPATAQWAIDSSGGHPSDAERLYEPQVNIRYGAWYIQWLQKQLQTENLEQEKAISLIAASYNAGLGNVENWLSEGIWDGSFEQVGSIPFGETRHFVNRVHYYYVKYAQHYPDFVER